MRFLQFLVVLVLARLLPPSVFGLVATAMIFAELSSFLITEGFSSGIVQQQVITSAHVRVSFTLATVQGFALGLFLWLGAPWLAVFFEIPQLESVARFLALRPVLVGLGATSQAILARKLEFRYLAQVNLQSFLISYALVGISLALMGYGAWALAWAEVIQRAYVSTAVYWKVRHSLRPSLALGETPGLFSFGLAGVFAQLGRYAAHNADSLIVARFLGVEALGFYRRAYGLVEAPVSLFSGILSNVLFPAFSSVQTEPERLRRAYRGAAALIALACAPPLVWIAVVAPELVRGLFGSNWEPAVPALQVLVLAGIARSVDGVGNALVRAIGVTVGRVVRDLLYALGVVCGSLAGLQWGLAGVAAGVAAATSIPYLLTARMTRQLIGVTWKEFFGSQVAAWGVAGLVGGVAGAATSWARALGISDLGTLVLVALPSAAAVVLVWFAVPRRYLGSSASWAIGQLEDRWRNRSAWLAVNSKIPS